MKKLEIVRYRFLDFPLVMDWPARFLCLIDEEGACVGPIEDPEPPPRQLVAFYEKEGQEADPGPLFAEYERMAVAALQAWGAEEGHEIWTRLVPLAYWPGRWTATGGENGQSRLECHAADTPVVDSIRKRNDYRRTVR